MSWGYAAASLLPGLLGVLGIQDYKGLDTNLKNKLSDFAQQLLEKWQLKQQEASYSPDHVSNSLPNRNQLQALMYQDFANETRQLAQDIQTAQQKDMRNWESKKGWYMLQDGVEGLLNVIKDINPLNHLSKWAFDELAKEAEKQGIPLNKYAGQLYHWVNKTEAKYKSRNKNLLEALEKKKKVEKSQKETFDKFNNYIIQSRDRFGRNNAQTTDYKSHSDNLNKNGTNQERTNRETKF